MLWILTGENLRFHAVNVETAAELGHVDSATVIEDAVEPFQDRLWRQVQLRNMHKRAQTLMVYSTVRHCLKTVYPILIQIHQQFTEITQVIRLLKTGRLNKNNSD